jgi:isocitrate lyase
MRSTWAAKCSCRRAKRSRSSSPRRLAAGLHGRADDRAGAHGRRGRPTSSTSDIDDNDKPFCTGERTVEGFYKTRAGLRPVGVARSRVCGVRGPHLVRDRQAGPRLREAVREAIQAKYPGKMLAYNCSPSFNWKKNLDDGTIARFQRELGAMGYRFQFITLAGFHSLNYSMFNLAHGYANNNMSAFVELQEAEFAARRRASPRSPSARSRHGLLRRGDDDGAGQPIVDDGAHALDRGRAVLRREEGRAKAANA